MSRRRQNLLMAIAHLGNDWHSGQFSRGYRLMGLAVRSLQHAGLRRPLDAKMLPAQKRIYNLLAKKYGNSL